MRESIGRGCAGRVPGGVLGAWGVCHARHPARRLPECVGVPGARAGCGVRGGVPCAGCVCAGSVPGVCRVCAGVLVGGVWAVWPVLEQCAGYVLVGRLVWGVVGVCRAVPAKRAGCVGCARCVPGVCQMCAARACMGRAAGVRGVCRECAGRARESMGRGCAGRVPGGVLGALGVCHARHPARRLPERAGVPGARAGYVPGVCWPCWVWESMRIGRLVWGVPGVCRECAGLCRPSVLGVSGVFPECAGSACRMCAGRAWVVPRVCGVCRVPGVGRVRVCRVCAGCVPVGGVWAGACKASSKGLPGAVCAGCVPAVLGVCRESMCRERACVGCGSCVPRVCRVCAAGCVLGVCRECAGLCRPSVLGVSGVCRECAGCVLGEHGSCCGCAGVRRVPGVCRECAGVLGVCRGVLVGVCRVCLVCAGGVPDVRRVCAGCVSSKASSGLLAGCAGVCRGCDGTPWVGCLPGVYRMCAG